MVDSADAGGAELWRWHPWERWRPRHASILNNSLC